MAAIKVVLVLGSVVLACVSIVYLLWLRHRQAKALLLQALVDGPGHGLGLAERVWVRTRGKIVLGQGSVYPALRALEREGLVDSWEAAPSENRGGRPKRYYSLTRVGELAVRAT